MLYVFHGTENLKVREKSSKLAESLLVRNSGSRLFTLSGDRFDEALFDEYLVGTTLFADTFVILCDDLLIGKQSKDKVVNSISAMMESPNIFILREAELDAKMVKVLEKSGAKIEDWNSGKKEKKEFSFDLPNAVMARDRKQAWVVYQQKLREGEDVERLFWQIWSGIKKALYVKKAGAASGFSPAAVAMTMRQSSKYSTEEVEMLASRFVDIFHASRSGEGELETGLERVLLEL